MTCPRCIGLLVPVASLLHESNGEYPYLHSDRQEDRASWRCIQCGHRTDPVIEQNRREHLDRALARLDVAERIIRVLRAQTSEETEEDQ